MATVNTLLSNRLKKKDQSGKATQLAKQSTSGQLTGFSGIFNISELSSQERAAIEDILLEYGTKKNSISKDLKALVTLSSEVKAINNQGALLHGERIQKAQQILKSYKEGAFSAWLVATYGNRQTPYNFLQYFEFCSSLPKPLKPIVENMPRQAVYTLASREGTPKEKEGIVKEYSGETKDELLITIREKFPLSQTDRRKQQTGTQVIHQLQKIERQLTRKHTRITKTQKGRIEELLEVIEELLQ